MSGYIKELIDSGEFDNTYPYPNKSYYRANGWDERYHEEKAEFDRQERLAREKFKIVALDEAGLTDHPNSDKMFWYAWEEAHSEGLYNIYIHLEELADLLLVNGKLTRFTEDDL